MASRLLLGDARTRLRQYVKPPGASDSTVNAYLNQVMERFINAGKWRGTMVGLSVAVNDGMFALPYGFETVLAAQFHGNPRKVRPLWFEFLTGSAGLIDAGKASEGPVEVPGLFPTFRAVPVPSYLSATSSGTETGGAALTVEGLDENGLEIFTAGVRGFHVTIGAGNVTSHQVSKITSVVKPATVGTITLTAHDVTAALPDEVVALYEPNETAPAYRWFKVSTLEQYLPVTILAKRAYVDAVADNDELLPANLGAFKLGLLALNYEDQNDGDLAASYWKQAFALLNQQTKEFLGPNAGSIQFQGHGYGASGIAALN